MIPLPLEFLMELASRQAAGGDDAQAVATLLSQLVDGLGLGRLGDNTLMWVPLVQALAYLLGKAGRSQEKAR